MCVVFLPPGVPKKQVLFMLSPNKNRRPKMSFFERRTVNEHYPADSQIIKTYQQPLLITCCLKTSFFAPDMVIVC